ncbi:tannase/feruloyl esterase family alpha/beta hydrolase [Robbsia sp. KACC 23696]|uniref:tannase/feruloyl esterase family alpha/beta hydrolase n=1 Tax=Robbsia sp. KACC 23696 TaxID=3149231 RepID=UPI00325AC18A
MRIAIGQRYRIALGVIAAFGIAFALQAQALAAKAAHAATPDTVAIASTPVAPGGSTQIVPSTLQCADLRNIDIVKIGGPGSAITSAREMMLHDTASCVVEGTLAPAIGFRLELPVSTWTQRFLQVGCEGTCGQISTRIGAARGCVPVRDNGFAVAATDMGHKGMDTGFGVDPEKRKDFAYRGQHLTALVSKMLILAYYGQAQRYAYFDGCSDGGREALIEAQRYPEDFDGIIAGAPAMMFQVQNALYHAWQVAANTDSEGKAIITAAALPLLHRAVLAQCDALDGQKDGILTDPRLCHFDPAVLQCREGQSGDANCLTPRQVETVRKLYDGPRDPKTGARLTIAGPQPGSELNWEGVFVPGDASQPVMSRMIAEGTWQYLALPKPAASSVALSSISFDAATLARLRAMHPLYDATNPDLRAFAARGGKLILWHGWADPHISPLNTIAYQEAMEGFMGKAAVDRFERLYLLPGVSHCGGGEGPSDADFLTQMLNWTEKAASPDAVVVSDADPGTALAPRIHGPLRGDLMSNAGGDIGSGGGRPDKMGRAGGMGGGMGRRGGMGSGAGESRGDGDFSSMDAALPMPQANSPKRTRLVYPYPAVAVFGDAGSVDSASDYVEHAPLYEGKTPDWLGADFFTPYSAPK